MSTLLSDLSTCYTQIKCVENEWKKQAIIILLACLAGGGIQEVHQVCPSPLDDSCSRIEQTAIHLYRRTDLSWWNKINYFWSLYQTHATENDRQILKIL